MGQEKSDIVIKNFVSPIICFVSMVILGILNFSSDIKTVEHAFSASRCGLVDNDRRGKRRSDLQEVWWLGPSALRAWMPKYDLT